MSIIVMFCHGIVIRHEIKSFASNLPVNIILVWTLSSICAAA